MQPVSTLLKPKQTIPNRPMLRVKPLLQGQRERPQVWQDMLNKHRRSMVLPEARCVMGIRGQPCRQLRVALNLKCLCIDLGKGCRLMRQVLLYRVLFLTHRPLQLLWHSEARGLRAEQCR